MSTSTTPATNTVATATGATASKPIRTPWSEFKKQPLALVAGGFVLFLVVIAILSPYISPYDAENYFDYDALNAGPSLQHWFGVDSLGHDIFSRILVGTQLSLAVGFSSVAVGAIVGTFLGLVAGYYEG